MRKRFPRGGGLFPLDRRGGFVRHVVHGAVDSPDLVRDSDRDAVEDLMRDFRVHRGHAVDRVDRANRDRLAVHPKIPVNPHGPHRQEDGEVLPRKGHETAAGRGLDLLLDDGGRASDEGDPIRRHFADHPNRESGPGKRLSLGDPYAERPGDRPDLVLVEVAQRFKELQLHVLREAADVVMGLDPISELAPALDPVRRDRPLDQMVGLGDGRLSLEELDELAPDHGPLLLRVHDAPQGREEFVRGEDDPVPHAEFLQGLRDVLGLSFPNEPGVDVDGEKAISEGATREHRCRRAVDAPRTGDDRLAWHGLADGLDLLADEGVRVEHHSPSVRESSRTHFFNASRCSLSLSTRRSSRKARISTARMAAFSPRSRPTAATGTPGGICETLRTASRFSLPLTGTPITGFVVWAAIVPGSAAERPAIAMKTFAVVFRIKSRRRSGVRWADATTMSYPTPNWSRNELACFPTSASVLEPRTMRTSTGIGWDKVGSWNKGFPLPRRSAETDLALHDCQEEEPNRRGGSNDRREDHADRLGDGADQVGACIVRARVPRPENPDDQTPHEKSDPNLAALPLPKYAVKAPVITRKSAKVKSKMVTNVNGSNASNGIDVLLKI